ncbi:MAG: hypothetical protein H0T73_16890 [Ardenticatenales bacterium]|nr:hypothetical protein [Ardenticatenales bacterium]
MHNVEGGHIGALARHIGLHVQTYLLYLLRMIAESGRRHKDRDHRHTESHVQMYVLQKVGILGVALLFILPGCTPTEEEREPTPIVFATREPTEVPHTATPEYRIVGKEGEIVLGLRIRIFISSTNRQNDREASIEEVLGNPLTSEYRVKMEGRMLMIDLRELPHNGVSQIHVDFDPKDENTNSILLNTNVILSGGKTSPFSSGNLDVSENKVLELQVELPEGVHAGTVYISDTTPDVENKPVVVIHLIREEKED